MPPFEGVAGQMILSFFAFRRFYLESERRTGMRWGNGTSISSANESTPLPERVTMQSKSSQGRVCRVEGLDQDGIAA